MLATWSCCTVSGLHSTSLPNYVTTVASLSYSVQCSPVSTAPHLHGLLTQEHPENDVSIFLVAIPHARVLNATKAATLNVQTIYG